MCGLPTASRSMLFFDVYLFTKSHEMKLFQKSFLITLALCLPYNFAFSATQTQHSQPKRTTSVKSYIKHYKTIAVAEMMRSGVPASITLAQGILESEFGNSRLARTANNHFGIKCSSSWQGEKAYTGSKKLSNCYRSYPDTEQSYRDHTNFLVGNKRYAKLFRLKTTDYEGWAKGLRKAGYATDPNYAVRLVSIIKRYRLHRFDEAEIAKREWSTAMLLAKAATKEMVHATCQDIQFIPANSLIAITQRVRLTALKEDCENTDHNSEEEKGDEPSFLNWCDMTELRPYIRRRKNTQMGAMVTHSKLETLDISGQNVAVAAEVVMEVGLVA